MAPWLNKTLLVLAAVGAAAPPMGHACLGCETPAGESACELAGPGLGICDAPSLGGCGCGEKPLAFSIAAGCAAGCGDCAQDPGCDGDCGPTCRCSLREGQRVALAPVRGSSVEPMELAPSAPPAGLMVAEQRPLVRATRNSLAPPPPASRQSLLCVWIL